MVSSLSELEQKCSKTGLLLRIQIRRPINLWLFKVVVAEKVDKNKIQIWGEMKGWAYGRSYGLQLDTMRVSQLAPLGVGHLVWAATMAWALEETPCLKARLLAINDEDVQHNRLVNYFSKRGFRPEKEVGSSFLHLPLRMIWGGSGLLMTASCKEVLDKSIFLWSKSY